MKPELYRKHLMGSIDQEATIVWHFGFQKTGTTAIQRLLTENREVLSEDMELFVKRGRKDRTRSLRRWGSAVVEPGLWSGPKEFRRLGLKRTVTQIAKDVSAHPKKAGLVSDENVIGHYVWFAGKSVFDNAAQIFPLVAAAAAPARSRFVMYTRDFHDWLASAWAQEVKRRRGTQSFDDWSSALPFEREWRLVEQRLSMMVEESGATVELRDMAEDRQENLPLGGRLLRILGVDDQKIRNLVCPPQVNMRLPSGAVEFLLEVNRTTLNSKSRRKVRDLVVRNKHYFTNGD